MEITEQEYDELKEDQKKLNVLEGFLRAYIADCALTLGKPLVPCFDDNTTMTQTQDWFG